jgi:translation initiation factor 2 subunit 3
MTTMRYYNIGLVGHVANGKTSLIESMTTVDTKRSHAEKKHSMTIQLGYANGILWRCAECNGVGCTNQNKKKWVCKDCKRRGAEVYRVSFVDAPGHHSLVATMIKGTSVMDGAILVTDVRKPDLQIQTLEHLAILETMGVRETMVVQNKCDLVNEKQCKAHYDMLKKSLKGTVASDAPIVPICANKGYNVDIVLKYMARMCRRISLPSTLHHGVIFSIIRTFDINRPNCDIDSLRGGVVGGTVVSTGTLCSGRDVEIRPGLVFGDGSYRPIRTKVLGIRSENDSVAEISYGGLFALGTNLDPTATKGDNLAGQVAGDPDDLPPVVNQMTLEVQRLKRGFSGEKLTKIKVQKAYILVLGNTIVNATCTDADKTHTVMRLAHPICTTTQTGIIYSAQDKKMIGFGKILSSCFQK